MKQTLPDYLKIYRNVIPRSVCDSTVEQIKNPDYWTKHTFYSANGLVDNGNEPNDYIGPASDTYSMLMKSVWDGIGMYIRELEFPWYTSWHGFNPLKFIQYNKDTEMHEHCDHVHSMFEGSKRGIPVLTVLGLLSDNYEGGNLTFFEDHTIDSKVGDLVIFPSVFLFPHKVENITYGTRYSFATFVY